MDLNFRDRLGRKKFCLIAEEIQNFKTNWNKMSLNFDLLIPTRFSFLSHRKGNVSFSHIRIPLFIELPNKHDKTSIMEHTNTKPVQSAHYYSSLCHDVVHSIVSLTSSLRGELVKVFYHFITKYTDFFFCWKMREAFAMQKLLRFFSTKNTGIFQILTFEFLMKG